MMTVYNCKATESMVNFAIIHGKLLDNFTTLDCLESDFCSNTIEASRLSGVNDEMPIAVANGSSNQVLAFFSDIVTFE